MNTIIIPTDLKTRLFDLVALHRGGCLLLWFHHTSIPFVARLAKSLRKIRENSPENPGKPRKIPENSRQNLTLLKTRLESKKPGKLRKTQENSRKIRKTREIFFKSREAPKSGQFFRRLYPGKSGKSENLKFPYFVGKARKNPGKSGIRDTTSFPAFPDHYKRLGSDNTIQLGGHSAQVGGDPQVGSPVQSSDTFKIS